MKKNSAILLTSLFLIGIFFIGKKILTNLHKISGAPPYEIEDLEPPEADPYGWIRDWKRPDVPARVGIQVGH